MTIEISIMIAGISLAFAIYQGISNLKRNNKQDAAHEATQLTTVIVKLEAIGSDVNEIKTDLRDIRTEVKVNSADIVRLKQQVKALEKTVFKNSESRVHEDEE